MLEVYFQYWCIYFETKKYSHPEIFLKQAFNIDAFTLNF